MLLQQVKTELDDFSKFYSLRTNEKTQGDIKFTKREDNYLYNQSAVINIVDYYFRSQFTESRFDDEGQRMVFINEVQFPVRVARKQVDIDAKDVVFVPETYEDAKKIKLVKRQFQDFAKEIELGQVINDLLDDYSKYGTCVARRKGDKIVRQPINTIINTQDAESLRQAAISGGYVMIKHRLYPEEMKEYPDWEVPKELKPHQKYTVYERYALMSGEDMAEHLDGDYEKNTMYFSMSIILEEADDDRKVMFVEEMDEDDFPLEEAHWERDTNRWLGVGEAENQFENQVAKNLSVNLRRRALLWASKKIFQSSDQDKADLNLIKEVSDGTVLEVGRDGAITQINAQTQHLGDFGAFEEMVGDNSQKKSFTFEAATGESMSSGTPFRLGVILSQATNTHFNLKKEQFADMLNRMFFNQVTEIFKDYPKAKRIAFASDEEIVEELRESIVEYNAGKLLMDKLLDLNVGVDELLGVSFDKEAVKEKIRAEVIKSPYFFVDIPDGYYDDLQMHMSVEVTGQYQNVEKEVETLQTILTTAMGNPQALSDPRIMKLIELILSKTGQSMPGFMGMMAQQAPELAGLANDALTNQTMNFNEAGNETQNTGFAG